MIAALITGIFFGIFAVSLALAYRNGKTDETLSAKEEREKHMVQADILRDRLLHDAGFAERMRKRFSR